MKSIFNIMILVFGVVFCDSKSGDSDLSTGTKCPLKLEGFVGSDFIEKLSTDKCSNEIAVSLDIANPSVSKSLCVIKGLTQIGIRKLEVLKSLLPSDVKLEKLNNLKSACTNSVVGKLSGDASFFKEIRFKLKDVDIGKIKDFKALQSQMKDSESMFSGGSFEGVLKDKGFKCSQSDIDTFNSIATSVIHAFSKGEMFSTFRSHLGMSVSFMPTETQMMQKIQETLKVKASCMRFKNILSIFNELNTAMGDGPQGCNTGIKFSKIVPPSTCPLNDFTQLTWAASNATSLIENFNSFKLFQQQIDSIAKVNAFGL